VVERALGRSVLGYHSQLMIGAADLGFELFVLED
jgi:hypothetical protein